MIERAAASFTAGALLCALAGCGGGSALPLAVTSPQSSCGAPLPPEVMARERTPLDVAFVPARSSPKRIYQPDWAGPVLFAPGQVSMRIPTRRFCAVEGEWTVPAAKPTINCFDRHEPTDGSSLWIALDGWSGTFKAHYKRHGRWHTYDSTDILQAGSESDVPCYHGGPLEKYKTSAYFWIEWSGTRNIAVTQHSRNLALHAGDTIYVRIAATTTGPRAWREATLTLVNETTGFYLPSRTFHSGCVDCGTPFARPATLFGNTAEWIVEATFYSSDNPKWPNTLDDFGNVEMTNVTAADQTGAVYDLSQRLGANLNVDWMTWNGVPLGQRGTLLACATIDGAGEATFARAPYTIATPGDQGKLEPKPKRC